MPNYFWHVQTEGQKLPLLEAGINPIAAVRADGGTRTPAILIASSPHKSGSLEAPWQDKFDVDNGRIRYFGDNKAEGDPRDKLGNRALLEQLSFHASPDPEIRAKAVPVAFFQRVALDGRQKGNVRFLGIGVLLSAERVTERHMRKNTYFANYVFEFAILRLDSESEAFDWDWISARRDPGLDLKATHALAPEAWKDWVKHGNGSIERLRRRVSRHLVTRRGDQQPVAGSQTHKVLEAIYRHYSQSHHRRYAFEFLASQVVQSILKRSGVNYREGWVTPPSSDGGADFVGRIDLGDGMATAKVVVLGQAKCESPASPTGGNHVARTVARLRRGWIGAYVTTSYFSDAVQMEIVEDQYPIMLVNGQALADEVISLMRDFGCSDPGDFFNQVDERHQMMIRRRRPEEILLD